MQFYCPDIICISETWLRDEEISPGNFYDSDIYTSFVNSRVGKRGGGELVPIKSHLKPKLISNGRKENIHCNVIPVAFGSTNSPVILMVI